MINRITDYFASVKGKKVAFIGLGRSNLPLIKMFCESGAVVYACDSRTKDKLGINAQMAEDFGATLCLGEGYLDNLQAELVFRTPGMNYNSPALTRMRQEGIEVTSEMELFFDLCPCKIIAVTGSDGKTTTTTIISELLKAQGYTVHLGGNIGNPLMPEIYDINEDDFAVVELSSFQLISMHKSPCVAVVTNLAPNHLDVHKDMEEYIDAKRNIVLYQHPGYRAVLNLDNDISYSFKDSTKADVMCFSRTQKISMGAYAEQDGIFYSDVNGEERIMSVEDIRIPGLHNVENFLAAICAVKEFVTNETIVNVARSFNGVKHRAQLVREYEGVKYYNDSIASSPTRTACGMLSLFDEKMILICGGYDKNIPYGPLGPVICDKVKTLILMGATALKIEDAVVNSANYKDGCPLILHADNMEDAVNLARRYATQGDVVALSPASASFDMYRDFEQRGEHFMSIVNDLS